MQNALPFIQYMPNKPDKAGIKFRLLVDICSKHLCNGKPYLGKDPTRNRENNLLADICLWLRPPCFKKGYNVAMENFLQVAYKFSKQTKRRKNDTTWHNKKAKEEGVES